jgi:hypothetical protein
MKSMKICLHTARKQCWKWLRLNQVDVQTKCHLWMIIYLLTICTFVPANNKCRCYHSYFCWKYDCDNMQASRSGISYEVKHKLYSFHTVLTSIASKQTKWVSCELHAYPFRSIDGISSFDATFFSEDPENLKNFKSLNMVKLLKKLQQEIQRNRTHGKRNMSDLQIILVCIELFCTSEKLSYIKIR